MLVKEYNDAQIYLDAHEANLLLQEAVSQLVLFDAKQNIVQETDSKCLFGVVMEEEPLLHFSNVPPHNLAIYAQNPGKEVTAAATSLLADYIAGNHINITGLNAKQDICQIFIEQYKKHVTCTFLEKLGTDIMEIREVNDVKPVEGFHRLARTDEAKLITEWMINFQLEALDSEINYEVALDRATSLIEEERLHIYEDVEHKPVSMAAAYRKLVNGMAINYIYTPEEYRGMGYAAANVYYMSKELLEQGHEFCTLLVDHKNPISCRAYEKVGYRVLDDNHEYVLLLS